MMWKWTLLVSVAMAALPSLASDPQKSPKGDMIVFYEDVDGGDAGHFSGKRIWLQSSENPKEEKLLFTHERSANVVFSGDEKWLVINDERFSNSSRALLYRRVKGLQYKLVKDLSDAWTYLSKVVGNDVTLDHNYEHANWWLGDGSKQLLHLTLYGHADHLNSVGNWECLIDLETQRYSLTEDMITHNRGQVTVDGVKNK